ncbi:heterokaryon incompatibility [Fusarium beomiforme]|uniref:Heterokaryon incompatibility n=1 Tax=Fusarium beomiforme TaxID=44412 RepID=A0A9P5A817_9HYPO|nr:heterokaryon incompatibility [Fusarium beomiforme]
MKEQRDKLVAISGLAEQMSCIVNDKYASGLWRKDLIRGLLWKTLPDTENEAKRYPFSGDGFVAPSWSWTSMETAVVEIWFGANFDHGILHGNFHDEDCPVGSSEVESLPVRASSDIEVLSVYCQPVTENPFGQLQSGTIRLRGYVRRYRWESGDDTLYDYNSQSKIGIISWDEAPPPGQDDVHVVCLYMAQYIPSSKDCAAFKHISEREQRFGKCVCLGLIETGVRANEFYRVGIAEIEYWQWDEDVKKEISLV